MSRTRARFTQADVARTIRAAKQAGATAVEIRLDGTIRVALLPCKGLELQNTLDPDDTVEL